MSKRYGRNQKRKHREEIAKLKERSSDLYQAHILDRSLLSSTSKDLEKARDTLKEIYYTIAKICPHSVVLPPQEITTISSDFPKASALPLYEHLKLSDVFCDCEPSRCISFDSVNLFALECFVEENWRDMGLAVHFKYSCGEHEAYMISRQALASIPTKELLERYVTKVCSEIISKMRGRL